MTAWESLVEIERRGRNRLLSGEFAFLFASLRTMRVIAIELEKRTYPRNEVSAVDTMFNERMAA